MFLGLSLRRLGRFEEAEKAYLEAIDLAPFDGLPGNELGLLHLARGRMDDALAAFRASAQVDSRNTSAVENLANLARADGRPADALEWYRDGHRRAIAHGDETERLKFRRYLDAVTREAESATEGRR
jgi:Flp pilus assembly protein TadD